MSATGAAANRSLQGEKKSDVLVIGMRSGAAIAIHLKNVPEGEGIDAAMAACRSRGVVYRYCMRCTEVRYHEA